MNNFVPSNRKRLIIIIYSLFIKLCVLLRFVPTAEVSDTSKAEKRGAAGNQKHKQTKLGSERILEP